ncbi:MAG: F0F1 ATP synthase subunit A [Chloroflexi bacterium]|nr:F0F1 ATP synthase subunit A [Chloroflexota bacterium]MCH7952309.1 F0F1 ATP synthase subunit A [Chloroflexota bacterium]MCI0784260.1 F0F1 ATP synthase subunit A [Chloroflexota bacterium]MCI0813682.1 F0F1 ATP synthase subunit A [Chloroflexota bacterium]MCI0817350.1 F0F1 ATP synthase subunit A [Chloroflexota bacterium]
MTRWLAIAGGLLAFLLGFVFLRGPTPHIAISAETLTTLGPVSITNTMITSWLIVALIVVAIVAATRKWELVPSGIQNLFEAALEGFYNMVTGIAGDENGRRFFPFVATIFFFILVSNWLSLTPLFNVIGWVGHDTPAAEQIEAEGFVEGIIFEDIELGPIDLHFINLSSPSNLRISSDTTVIKEDDPDAVERFDEAVAEGNFVGELIPVFRGPNTDLNTPLAIAIASFIAVEFWGISSLGALTYGRKFINFGKLGTAIFKFKPGLLMDGIIDAFVGILELISELVRLVSFTFRLFGNMFAGEVIILMFTFLTPIILTLPFYGLEIFVGAIQAFIFAMLTLVFAVMAVSLHGEVEEEHAPKSSGADAAVEAAN